MATAADGRRVVPMLAAHIERHPDVRGAVRDGAPVWVFPLKGVLAPCRRDAPCVAKQERAAGAVMTNTAITEVRRSETSTTWSVMDDTLPPLHSHGHVVTIRWHLDDM